MSEWFTLVFVTAVVAMTATILLSKGLGRIKNSIKVRQEEAQRKREQRELYLKLLKLKNSRRRRRRGPKR